MSSSSALLRQQEGFTRNPKTFRTIIEQRTPSLIPMTTAARSPVIASVAVSEEVEYSKRSAIIRPGRANGIEHVSVVKEEGEDVETVIVSAGLKPVERIMSLSVEGHKMIRYSKCVDEHNNACLIEHDDFGHVAMDAHSSDLYEEHASTSVISSLKNQVCDMSKKHGCTMSIGSAHGYFIADHWSQVQKEVFFSRMKHICQKGQICEVGEVIDTDIQIEHINILPVFKFSNLKCQKEAILKKLAEITLHILCVLNKMAEEKNKEFQCQIEEDLKKWNEYKCKKEAYVKKLHDKLRKLECLLKEFETDKSKIACNEAKYNELKDQYRHCITNYAKFNRILMSSYDLFRSAKEIENTLCRNLLELDALDKCC